MNNNNEEWAEDYEYSEDNNNKREDFGEEKEKKIKLLKNALVYPVLIEDFKLKNEDNGLELITKAEYLDFIIDFERGEIKF